MATIELRNGRKSFETEEGSELLVLDDIDLVAKDEHFTCILGTSGSGKSTLLNCIAGLLDLDAGELSFSDVDNPTDGRPSISYVFQEPRVLNWKTVKENLEFGMKGMGIPEEEWDRRAEEYLELVGIEEFANQHPLYLSGGQRQRVSIARALCIEPDVLLMDEPFSALDEITARTLREDLLEIVDALDQTVLFVTHNAAEAAFLSDEIVLLTDRPASVSHVLENPLPHPRDLEDPDLIEFKQEILQKMGVYDRMEELAPEAGAGADPGAEQSEFPRRR